METEMVAVAQIVRLIRARPHVVWDLIPPSGPARSDDIPLRDLEGEVVGYARPAVEGSCLPSS